MKCLTEGLGHNTGHQISHKVMQGRCHKMSNFVKTMEALKMLQKWQIVVVKGPFYRVILEDYRDWSAGEMDVWKKRRSDQKARFACPPWVFYLAPPPNTDRYLFYIN